MSPRRPDQATLYELMRESRPDQEQVPVANRDEPDSEAQEGQEAQERRRRRSAPLLLRVPRGYLVVAAVVSLGVVVLAYAVGYSRGHRAGRAEARAEADSVPMIAVPPAPPLAGEEVGGRADSPGRDGAGGEPAPRRVGEDTRQPGFNYFVLAQYDRPEARRLVAFLHKHGVEAFAKRVNNKGLYHVIGLRGFSAAELETIEYDHYVREIKQLGRIWNDRHGGASDLTDLWPRKYDG